MNNSVTLGCCGACCQPCMICGNARALDQNGCLTVLGCFLPCISIYLLRKEARKQYDIEVNN